MRDTGICEKFAQIPNPSFETQEALPSNSNWMEYTHHFQVEPPNRVLHMQAVLQLP